MTVLTPAIKRFSLDTNLTGAQGANGADGAPGAVWRSGVGVPSNSLGVNGDYYFNNSNNKVYLKSAGTYSIVTDLTGNTGAKGITGDAGVNGSVGATGATGAKGATGDAGANGSAGAKGATGDAGGAGSNGSNGSNGTNGTNGSNLATLLSASATLISGGTGPINNISRLQDGLYSTSATTTGVGDWWGYDLGSAKTLLYLVVGLGASGVWSGIKIECGNTSDFSTNICSYTGVNQVNNIVGGANKIFLPNLVRTTPCRYVRIKQNTGAIAMTFTELEVWGY